MLYEVNAFQICLCPSCSCMFDYKNIICFFFYKSNFQRWQGRVIWSNLFTTFFVWGGGPGSRVQSPESRVQSPESSRAFSNRICPKHNMTSRQDNTMHKRQDDMTSRQDDMTNSIMESRPIETFASKFNFFCQSNVSYYL